MNLDERRRRAAYHESGHAVAAVIRRGYVKYIDLTKADEEEQETGTSLQAADEAFMVWAGPWAQARWETDCTEERIKAIFLTQSFWDLPLYEARFGRDVKEWALGADFATQLGRPLPEQPPSVTSPLPGWDAELNDGWTEIEALADSLLRGVERITLSNGQMLVRDGDREYWSDESAPSVLDDDQLPAVR